MIVMLVIVSYNDYCTMCVIDKNIIDEQYY
jgi:hypothetical protein